ncbi:hypothetical protein M9H77_14219 [Catharanthus roseus]|uniref:Uncharacterized protein n=1 Tax=Catharanthus roseus TaxID=4058 RepID=A0ACC0BMH1_CATRO|nr:hypothetical protein M9H77_14219 [Catharanthus roseus]
MEIKSKQEDHQSKFARDMRNFYLGGGNGSNVYDRNNHENGDFTPKRHNGVNFEYSSKEEDRKLAYKSVKTINIFSSNYYLSFEIYFKEIKLFSLVFMENGYQFYFLNSLGTLIEKKQFVEINSNCCAILRLDEYQFNIPNFVSCVLEIEDKERNMEKELGAILEELSISCSLIPSLMCYEELLLKDLENQMETNLELFKVNTLAFEKSNLTKEAFEQAFEP